MSSAEVLASVDIVALRLDCEAQLELLVLRRPRAPFAGQWALPGVLVNGRSADVSLEAAAARALASKARLQPAYLEQVATLGNAVRDPRGWSLSTFYLALVPPQAQVEGEDLRFVPLAEVLQGRLPLPFDHLHLVRQAGERLASKAVYSGVPLYLLEEHFTVTEALAAFQACIGQPVQHTTLRGRLERMKSEGWILDTGEKNQPRRGRPQTVWRHTPRQSQGVFTFDRSVLI
ncbi:MAG: NUDIX domain-containing protein [Pseudomonas sp.]|uniref:NUDIX domain-containing protein n=1 Tax=Pseudomonas sp. TaxID=306 RepID=UPI0033981235